MDAPNGARLMDDPIDIDVPAELAHEAMATARSLVSARVLVVPAAFKAELEAAVGRLRELTFGDGLAYVAALVDALAFIASTAALVPWTEAEEGSPDARIASLLAKIEELGPPG